MAWPSTIPRSVASIGHLQVWRGPALPRSVASIGDLQVWRGPALPRSVVSIGDLQVWRGPALPRSVASIGDLQVWRGPALPKPSTHSVGSSCMATQHAPPHLLQAFAGIAVERVRGRARTRGSGCITGATASVVYKRIASMLAQMPIQQDTPLGLLQTELLTAAFSA